ncbi:uncharacterized protein LOC114259007 [Camellia sinensis]|uniref:uncharacterized protein LOC114259007 n=1 Tax=Camellia sinensis TaxID=4442 RepID=UPI0010368787|nr:uncharacterized protein LOC114259007 [Camellia sinensis]
MTQHLVAWAERFLSDDTVKGCYSTLKCLLSGSIDDFVDDVDVENETIGDDDDHVVDGVIETDLGREIFGIRKTRSLLGGGDKDGDRFLNKIDSFFKKIGSQDIEVNATTKHFTDNVEASIPEQRPREVPRIESKEVDTSSLKVNSGKNCAFLTHIGKDPNSSHRIVIKSCHDLTIQAQHIEKLVEKQTSQQVAKNRLWLKTTIDAVKWLTFHACAFRGCDESHDSNNQENIIELIKLLASYNADVADVVCILEEIHEAKFCIIVDEARDESKREQMAIVLRFVDKDGFIKEHFFDIVHVSDTTSATLKEEIYIVLSHHNLSVQNICGQGYDGACNMRGEWTGLPALFLHDNHFTYYVHCFAHRLQLALVATAREVIAVVQFFSYLDLTVNLCGSSCKRHDQLKVAQAEEIVAKLAINEVETGKGKNQVGTFKRVGDTRWSSYLGFISNADGVYDKITSLKFVFILHLMRDNMGTTDDLCQVLQYILDMSARYTSSRGRACHQRDHITIEHHFWVDIFTITCDPQLQELNNRFKEDVMELLILSSALDPKDDYNSFKIEDICKLANQFYPNHFIEQEKIHLKFQLQNYEIDILKHPKF